MIQIVLFSSRKFINDFKHFQDNKKIEALQYIDEALRNKEHTTIEITKWDDKTGERK